MNEWECSSPVRSEDADGVHIVDACFSGSLRAEITHLARALCAAPCQSPFCIYTKINTRVGYFPDSARLCHVADVRVRKHHSCHPKGGNKINRLSIVSCYCKLLSGNTVNWPLLNLARHCLAEPDILLFLLLCFLSRSLALSLRRVFPVPPCWPHTANSRLVMKRFSPGASLRTSQGNALTSVCRRSYLSPCERGQVLCVCSCVWFEKNLVLQAQKHRLEKTGTGSETSEPSKHASKTSSGNYSRRESHLLSL